MSEEKTLPKGWKWVKLDEMCNKISLNKIKIKQKDYLPQGKYPVVDQGQELIGGYYDDDSLVIPSEPPYIVFGDHTKAKKYISFNFIAGADGVKVLKAKDGIDPKYLYYSLFTIKIEDKGYARHFQLLEKENFPLPVLSTQQAIVSKIEELLSELDNGIAQLRTAQQQLETYRQAVLKYAFEGRLTNANVKDGELPKGWKWVKITDVTAINPKLPFENIKDDLEVSFLPMKLVEEEKNIIHLSEFKKYKDVKKGFTPMTDGDVIFAKITPCMENGKIAVVHSLKNKIAFGSTEFHVMRCHSKLLNKYLFFYLVQDRFRINAEQNMTGAVGQRRVPKKYLEDSDIPLPTMKEQQQIVNEIERRLSVADKLEETITTSLQQSACLRQSILKQAFEGKLVKEVEAQPEIKPYKPKNVYFYQSQILGYINQLSNEKDIQHGEMTTAKYSYLLDRLYDVPTYFDYRRLHLGPFPPEMKKVINNKRYFTKSKGAIKVINADTLFKYPNPYKERILSAIEELSDVFAQYSNTERPDKIELLATVCKVIEDTESIDLSTVRQSMQEWVINLPNSPYKNKAEKFTEKDTRKCIGFIVGKGWDEKLLDRI